MDGFIRLFGIFEKFGLRAPRAVRIYRLNYSNYSDYEYYEHNDPAHEALLYSHGFFPFR